jgi:hypothetical protein
VCAVAEWVWCGGFGAGDIIEESTGEMIDIKSDCVMLDGVVCAADFHRFCTRAIFPYWREIWLEKLEGTPDENGATASCSGC